MPEPVEITLRYVGRDVESGTMPVSDVIVALKGFSGAYGKIATAIDRSNRHEIRVSQIKKFSFAVVVLDWINEHTDLVKAVASPAVPTVATLIIKLIDFKKRNKGNEPTVQINGDGNVVLMGEGNTQVIMPKELYKTLQSKSLDADFEKIVRPLEANKIDRAELTIKDDTGHIEHTEIEASEKQYFKPVKSSTVTSKRTEIVGNFVSLNKKSNRGEFRMQNGTSVPYQLSDSEGDPARMYPQFARMGLVKAKCIAKFDENLEPQSLEITSVEPL